MDCEAGAGKGTHAASGRTRRQPVLLRQKPPRPRMFTHQPRGTLPRQFVNLGSHHFQSRSYAVISAEERYPVSSSGCEEGDSCDQWGSWCKRGAERSRDAGAGASCSQGARRAQTADGRTPTHPASRHLQLCKHPLFSWTQPPARLKH